MDTATTDADRPQEGDLIYTPVIKRLFEISFVDHDEPFHQLDNNPVYKLDVNSLSIVKKELILVSLKLIQLKMIYQEYIRVSIYIRTIICCK